MGKESATCQELTQVIQDEIPFLKFESPYKVKAEYVLPTLEKSRCFVNKGKDVWKLSDLFLNLENHAYDILAKGGKPLTLEQLTETIAEKASLHTSDIPLKLGSDERFCIIPVGKIEYFFINSWELCNDYAFAIFIQNKNESITLEEAYKLLASKFKKVKKTSILMLDEDPRFRDATDGRYSLFPRELKRFRKTEVLKRILDEIFKRMEAGEKTVELKDIGEEFLDMPFPLTNIEDLIEADLRFNLQKGDKVKRSKYSIDEIKEMKREERRKRSQENARKAKIKQEQADKEAKLFAEDSELERIREDVTEPLVAQESASFEPQKRHDEVRKLGEILQDFVSEEESVPEEEPAPKEEKDAFEELPFVKKKSAVIKKSELPQREAFDLESTGVDLEELSGYMRELTDYEGALQDLSPERFDELLRRHLAFKVSDYKPTSSAVARFVVDLARPRLDQIILDPVCGRGDFLLQSLQALKFSLRKDHSGDLETFETFCDEQIVGMDQSDFILRGARLNLQLGGFNLSLLEPGNSLEDTDILIDEMYTLVMGDFAGFNTREMKQYLATVHRVLSEDNRAILVLDGHHMVEDGEVSAVIQEKFLLRHQVVFTDVDGVEKNVLHLVKSSERREKTKVFRLDSIEQLRRVLDMVF
jgi:hypothetical protein